MWIGHPHMVGWRLAALNAVVVLFAREYSNLMVFCHAAADLHSGTKFEQRKNVDALKTAVAEALQGLVRDDG